MDCIQNNLAMEMDRSKQRIFEILVLIDPFCDNFKCGFYKINSLLKKIRLNKNFIVNLKEIFYCTHFKSEFH